MRPVVWLRRSFAVTTLRRGAWDDNPVFMQVLGICSALAVTNLLVNTLVMCAGLIFAGAMSSATVSLLRNQTPRRVRMMAQVLIIASYVICVDITIKAYLPTISEALGPYVGLIITNCIIMGRCEAYASKNPPWPAFLDGRTARFRHPVRLCRHARGLHPLDDHDHAAGRLFHVGPRHLALPKPSSAPRPGRVIGNGTMEQTSVLTIFIASIFINNILLSNFLGMCSFIAVSREIRTAAGLGAAVIFVMTLTSGLNFLLYKFLLVPLGLEYLRYIAFIVVIAATVQLVEMVIEKTSPALYYALGIFLPLITVNCAILGVSLFMVIRGYSFVASLAYGAGSGVGWALAILAMAGLRKKMKRSRVHPALEGAGITLIIAGVMALAFTGFSGMVPM
jgi:Na+-transporting NADH:ubiquinone oxidoreductase subunit E